MTTVVSHSPARRAWQARWNAVEALEQAVSTVMLGPERLYRNEIRLAITDSELPVMVYGLMLSGSLRATSSQCRARDEISWSCRLSCGRALSKTLIRDRRKSSRSRSSRGSSRSCSGGGGALVLPEAHAHELCYPGTSENASARAMQFAQLYSAVHQRFSRHFQRHALLWVHL